MEMVKIYEIEPAGNSHFDTHIVEAGKTWEPALEAIEESLERQFLEMEDNEREWDEITATVKCREMSREELDRWPDE